MSERTFRIVSAIVLGLAYVGLFGYSVSGHEERQSDRDDRASRVRPPMVIYHDSGVNVYKRRSVRSSNQRGGGIRGGK